MRFRIQMGAAASHHHDPRHVRIWSNLCNLASISARIQMLDTLFTGQEYVVAAKRAGVYASLLQWMAAQRRGEFCPWPSVGVSEAAVGPTRSVLTRDTGYSMLPPPVLTKTPVAGATFRDPMPPRPMPIPPARTGGSSAVAVIPPPKRALDTLHESYSILGLDDTKPLTHEALRLAYKRAAVRAHPDKGGSPEAFDAVTRAFLYVQEVLEKLIPKAPHNEARFSTPVTPETAMAARGIHMVAPAPKDAMKLEDAPPIALNPKKLDMNLFNKLFEENKLPDPERDDGYGEWLKSQEAPRGATNAAMRGKYNKDLFNKMFEEEARRGTSEKPMDALSKYKPPSELVLAPGFGTELGSGRPAQFTKTSVTGGRGLDYTDLKHAYGDGSTFSQEVSDVSMDGRPRTLDEAKRAYGAAPDAMSTQEAAAVAAFERAKAAAEEERRRRLAVHDVEAESLHERMKSRLMIRN